jgi:hypothetical protein
MDDTDGTALSVPHSEALKEKDSPKKRKKSIREAAQDNEGDVVGIRNISAIRSKIRRNQEWVRLKKEKKKEKRKRQDDRKKVSVPTYRTVGG